MKVSLKLVTLFHVPLLVAGTLVSSGARKRSGGDLASDAQQIASVDHRNPAAAIHQSQITASGVIVGPSHVSPQASQIQLLRREWQSPGDELSGAPEVSEDPALEKAVDDAAEAGKMRQEEIDAQEAEAAPAGEEANVTTTEPPNDKKGYSTLQLILVSAGTFFACLAIASFCGAGAYFAYTKRQVENLGNAAHAAGAVVSQGVTTYTYGTGVMLPFTSRPLLNRSELGIIRLDYDYPPVPGDIASPKSFEYQVIYRVVPGLTFEMCQSGKLTAEVAAKFKEGLEYLIKQNVGAITGDCGFMMYFQEVARQYTKLPVLLSALVQLPSLTLAYGPNDLIAIFTANGEAFKPMRGLIKQECKLDPEEKRFVVVGCDDVPGFEAVALGKKVDNAKVTPGMIAKARKVVTDYPNVRAFLLECTELPQFADAMREETGLPVYDALTGCNFFMAGLLDNPRIGLDDWQKVWDGQQKEYRYGANLSEADKARLVNQAQAESSRIRFGADLSPEQFAHLSTLRGRFWKTLLAAKADLGMLQCDYDYQKSAGVLDQPQSFLYRVRYVKVTGLTRDMCESGMMTPVVEKRFIESIADLEKQGVVAITGDCQYMMSFQKKAREFTKLPVFMSALCQVPAVLCGFAPRDALAIVTAKASSLKKMQEVVAGECQSAGMQLMLGAQNCVVVGCEDVRGYAAVATPEIPIDEQLVTPGITAKVKLAVRQNPNIRAIILADARAPVFSDALRKETRLPVYDAITACNFYMAGRFSQTVDQPILAAPIAALPR